jgi:CRP/FNR family transcriptional regulator, putaive post-exponential-phase nitrogen-starvation regulator
MDEKNKFIEQFKLREHLNTYLINHARLFAFPANYDLYLQTQEQIFFYILVSGSVQVSYFHENGKLSVLALLSPVALIGDLELFNTQLIRSTVVTLTETRLLGIEKTVVQQYGYDDVRFLRFIIRNLTEKLYENNTLQTGNVLTLANRIASYLLHNTTESRNTINIPSKSHLAGLLGATPRHLNRVLRQFQQEHLIIVQENRIQILNRANLDSRSLND